MRDVDDVVRNVDDVVRNVDDVVRGVDDVARVSPSGACLNSWGSWCWWRWGWVRWRQSQRRIEPAGRLPPVLTPLL